MIRNARCSLPAGFGLRLSRQQTARRISPTFQWPSNAQQGQRCIASSSTASTGSSPTASPTPPAKSKRKLKWYWHALIIVAELAVVDYFFDKYVLGGATFRTADAYGTLAFVGLDYKLHYGPASWLGRKQYDGSNLAEKEAYEQRLHRRNAERIVAMLKRNGGLYTKMGQALAMQGSVFPQEYQRMFGEMFDDAPKTSWKDIKKVIEADFDGKWIENVFPGVRLVDKDDGNGPIFETEPRASASIAQVHFARLADGREVAVKVQKPLIAKQVGWDLWSLKVMADYTAWMTGLPMASMGEFVSKMVMEETDFMHEASNSEEMSKLLASDPRLKDRVYVPKVYRDLTTTHILTTEWIHGHQLWQVKDMAANKETNVLGTIRLADVMGTVIELFSTQMFRWGFVHCDPHPGNILVRRLDIPTSTSSFPTPLLSHNKNTNAIQLVLLDHGLYVRLSDDLRRQYAHFWEAMVTGDDVALQEVASAWGMKSADAWAEASLFRPYKKADADNAAEQKQRRSQETPEERKQRMIDEAGAYLGEEGMFPQELIFLERNVTLVQGNNQFLGSPVNRVKMMGMYAMRALREDDPKGTTGTMSWQAQARRKMRSTWALMILDTVYYWSWLKQYWGYGDGFEAELKEAEDRQSKEMKDAVAALFGIVID